MDRVYGQTAFEKKKKQFNNRRKYFLTFKLLTFKRNTVTHLLSSTSLLSFQYHSFRLYNNDSTALYKTLHASNSPAIGLQIGQ